MKLSLALNCILFALWVSVCAAAPEFIWRGFILASAHITLSDVYSALVLAMFLGFFVEPVMERVKLQRWELEHHKTRNGLLYTALISLVFGVVAVCVHEAMNAHLGGESVADHDKEASFLDAIEQIREWGLIPFAVTIAWFGARAGARVAILAGILACAWVVAIDIYYDATWPLIIATSIPCYAIIWLGQWWVVRRGDDKTLVHLAGLTSSAAVGWFAIAWLAEGGAWLLGDPNLRIYGWEEFGEDFRFYAGWSLGLAVAPDPIPRANPSA
jgi:hypothetical protein